MADHEWSIPAGEDWRVELSAADVERVRAVLVLGGVPWDEVEDGVQHVRLKLLEEDADPRRPVVGRPGAWCAVVASRVAVDWHRARSRDAGLRERLAARWSARPPGDVVEQDVDLALAVGACLGDLPLNQRQVLVLRFYADLPVAQLAELLQIPEGTVKSRLHAALSALGSQLREREVI